MSIPAGTHRLGPENGTLSVRTGRTGAAAKAGHDLLIHVTAWQATLEVGEDPAQTSIVLDADATSLRVREGTGGMQALGDDDKASIQQTIDDEVLKRTGIEFRSTAVQTAADGSRIERAGRADAGRQTRPIAFDLTVGDDGRLSGSAVVKQTDWGITPYSTLFGALKVVDEVEVVIDASSQAIRAAAECPTASSQRVATDAPLDRPGVSSFLWALSSSSSSGSAWSRRCLRRDRAALALVASFLIFVFVRTQGAGRDGRSSVAVDGLRVEPALDPRRQGAGAVRVEGDVLDRLDLRGVAPVRADPRAVDPRERLRRGSERHAREQLRLGADLPGGADDRRRGALGRARVVAVTDAEPVGVRGNDLDVERGDAELVGDELRVLRPPSRRTRWSG